MSVFVDEVVTCPYCGDVRARSVARSIHAGRSPHFRVAILEGEFQRPTCDRCQQRFEIGSPFLYVDPGRGQWFGVFAASEEDGWQRLEGDAGAALERCRREDAPAFVREELRSMKVRTVFGLNALREKLLCFEHGLDDVSLEVLKFSFGLKPDQELLSEDTHLRLMEVTPEALILWLGGVDSAQELTELTAGRVLYDDIVLDPERWASLREVLGAGSYVDIGRIVVQGQSPI